MSSVLTYRHPSHHGHVEYVAGEGHVMTHKWAHGGPDVRKSYATHEKAKAALHRAVKAGNVTARAHESAPGPTRLMTEAATLSRLKR